MVFYNLNLDVAVEKVLYLIPVVDDEFRKNSTESTRNLFGFSVPDVRQGRIVATLGRRRRNVGRRKGFLLFGIFEIFLGSFRYKLCRDVVVTFCDIAEDREIRNHHHYCNRCKIDKNNLLDNFRYNIKSSANQGKKGKKHTMTMMSILRVT